MCEKSAKDIEATFREELTALLSRWKASLEVENHWTGYAECGEDIRLTAFLEGICDEGVERRPSVSIDLGRSLP